jgi:hypothetical protein
MKEMDIDRNSYHINLQLTLGEMNHIKENILVEHKKARLTNHMKENIADKQSVINQLD